MSKGLIFFCCACAILLFTIINLSIGPIINHKTYMSGTENCAILSDGYDLAKKGALTDSQKKYDYEWDINRCKRKKAMYNMEYTSFIFDIVIGFICSLLGLLHIFEVKKDFVANSGLVGLICGVVGFVLSLVYVIFNALVFTNGYTGIPKTDENGAYAKLTNDGTGEYKCLNYDDSGDIFATYAKFSELNKKQYNYDKDLLKSYEKDEVTSCADNDYAEYCSKTGTYTDSSGYLKYNSFTTQCPYIYAREQEGITNKDIFDRFLTVLILSLVVCLANIGLALFGFLLFRTPGDF